MSFTKGERECPWPAGSVVGLALHKGLTSLPSHPESPKGGESGVPTAVIWHKRQQWTHGLKGDNLPDILEEDNISNTDVYFTEIIYRKNVLLLH